jgi:hypothetical protein
VLHRCFLINIYKYTKFTTDNNDIRNGVHLKFGENYVPLKIDEIETSMPSVTKAFADQIEAMSCNTEGSGRSSRYICDYALSMNSGYTERFYSVELGGEKYLKFIVIGEKLKRDANTGAYKAISKGEKYVSKFYKDKNIERFIKSAPVQKIEELIDYSLVKQQTQYFNIEQYIITDDSDKKGLFEYLYEIDKSSYKFRQGTSSPENVRFLKDAFEEKAGEETTTKEGPGNRSGFTNANNSYVY